MLKSESPLNETHTHHALSWQDTIEKLCENAEVLHLDDKSTLYRKGDMPFFFYVIKSGMIKSYNYHDSGKEYICEIHQAGDFFGYESIFQNTPYYDTTECISDCEIYKIPKTAVFDLLKQNHYLSFEILNLICSKIETLKQNLLDLSYSSVRKRVAHILMKLSHTNGVTKTDISRTNLASLVGTSPETLTRILTEFKADQVIHTHGNNEIEVNLDKITRIEKVV